MTKTFRTVRLTILAWLLVLGFRMLVFSVGFNKASKFLPPVAQGAIARGPNSFPFRVAQAVNRAAVFVPRATCLVRACAAKYLLHRRQFSSELCVGVAKNIDEPLKAHAWLVWDGVIILGNERNQVEKYKPLTTYV